MSSSRRWGSGVLSKLTPPEGNSFGKKSQECMNDFIKDVPGCCHAAEVCVRWMSAEFWSLCLLNHWPNYSVFFPFPFSFSFSVDEIITSLDWTQNAGAFTSPTLLFCSYSSAAAAAAADFDIGKNSTLAKKNGLKREIDVTCETFVSVGTQALLDFTDGEKWTLEGKNEPFQLVQLLQVLTKTPQCR